MKRVELDGVGDNNGFFEIGTEHRDKHVNGKCQKLSDATGTDRCVETCMACRFFENINPESTNRGWCRRYPPQVLLDGPESLDQWSFPYMEPQNWCGEFKKEKVD